MFNLVVDPSDHEAGPVSVPRNGLGNLLHNPFINDVVLRFIVASSKRRANVFVVVRHQKEQGNQQTGRHVARNDELEQNLSPAAAVVTTIDWQGVQECVVQHKMKDAATPNKIGLDGEEEGTE